MTAIIINHDDSFTHNVQAWLKGRFAVDVKSYNQVAAIDTEKTEKYDLVVISPGPKSPYDYPSTLQFLKNLPEGQHCLGICLGFQLMCISDGGSAAPYAPPLHGKTSTLHCQPNNGLDEFNFIQVARYHSIACQLPPSFQLIAQSDNIPMWAKHQSKKWMGLQFHPESFLTQKPTEILNYIHEWSQK